MQTPKQPEILTKEGMDACPLSCLYIMIFRAIIFDLDGTLLDTLRDIGEAMNRVLTAQGFPKHAIDAYKYFVGNGAKPLVHDTLPETARSPEMVEHYLKIFLEDYGQNWSVNTRPYPGVSELLDALRAQGRKMSIFTNKPQQFALNCVDRLLPHWSFDHIVGQQDGFPRKPDPAGALRIAKSWGIPPSEILYIGDTGTDMQTAVAAGMCPVGVLWGFRERKELEEHGAQLVLERPQDLLSFLESALHPL